MLRSKSLLTAVALPSVYNKQTVPLGETKDNNCD